MTDPESGRFTTRYLDRRAAGRALAPRLRHLSGLPGLVVLGLPRGGVPVADEVARSLGAPLDVLVVRKLGVPGQEELAFGAIAEGGARWLNEGLIQALGLDAATIARVTREQQEELGRRVALFRQGRPAVALEGRVVVVVDDGLATGATTYAAVQALRARTPTRIIVAVPVASREACALLRPAVDELVVAATPEPFHGVGAWYDDFRQTTDDEVGDILAAAATRS